MVAVWRSKINFGFKGSEQTNKHQERKIIYMKPKMRGMIKDM